MIYNKHLLIRDRLYIDGRWVPSAAPNMTEVINPATGEPIGSSPMATFKDVACAVAAARRAFDEGDWPRLPQSVRAAAIRRVADLYRTHDVTMAGLITTETGSPITFSLGPQVQYPQDLLDVFSSHAYDEQIRHEGAKVRREPVGVVAVITPARMPQRTIMEKIGPALLAGCTVVIKPSLRAPLDALLLAEIVEQAGLPPGVVNVIPAHRSVGEHLAGHPGVDMVAFTGAASEGKRIATECARAMRPVSLDLDGRSTCIVLDDADLDHLVTAAPSMMFANSGQLPTNQTRILVPRTHHDAITARLTEMIHRLTVGDPEDRNTDIGPLATAIHREAVQHRINDSIRSGADIAVAAERPNLPGWYMSPALVVNVDNRAQIAQDPLLAPVLTLTAFDDDEHAITLANDTHHARSAGIWTQDTDRARYIARRLRFGTVDINGTWPTSTHPPTTRKRSGYGAFGLDAYVETKVIAGL